MYTISETNKLSEPTCK